MSKRKQHPNAIALEDPLPPGEHKEGWGQTAASLSEPIDVSITEIIDQANKAKEAEKDGQVRDI